MDRFVSNYTLRLDAKGRVSIPAPFRGVLVRDGFEGLYCYPTLDQPAIDAGGNALMADIERLISRYPPYSDEREEFLVALYGTSQTLKLDGEGRVSLTDDLKAHAEHHRCRDLRRASGTSFRSGNRSAFARTLRRPPRLCARRGVPGRRGHIPQEHGNDGGPRRRETGRRWRTGSSHSRAGLPSRGVPPIHATAASSSTRPSGPAVTRAPSCKPQTAGSSASTAIRMRSRTAPTLLKRRVAASVWWRTGSPRSPILRPARRSMAWSSISASPRCSSIRRSAAFRSAPKGRSTCAWTATVQPRLTWSPARPNATSPL